GDRPRVRAGGGTSAHVRGCFDRPVPRRVGERARAAGHDVNTRGSEHTLVFRMLKASTDGKEYAVLAVGPDDDRGAAKGSLIILDAHQRSREVSQMRRLTGSVDVQLRQSTGQMYHTRDRSRAGGGERHLLVDGGYGFGCSGYRRDSENNQKQRQYSYSEHVYILL